jgi:integrase
VVLTKEEVAQILSVMEGMAGLITKLCYARGLRIAEVVRLRVQDIDFGFKQITGYSFKTGYESYTHFRRVHKEFVSINKNPTRHRKKKF